MGRRDRIGIAATLLLAAACTSPGDEGAGASNRPSIPLAEAIRIADMHEEGWIPVAAGVRAEAWGTYDVALLSGGVVREASVDAARGAVVVIRERAVREGFEDFSTKLESAMSGAEVDLARAVELAAAAAPDRRVVGVGVEESGERLVYRVSLLGDGKPSDVAVDMATGSVEPVRLSLREGSSVVVGRTASEFAAPPLDFENTSPGALPVGWRVEATGGDGPLATWRVEDDDPPSARGRVLSLSSTNHRSESAFNLCWTEGLRFRDGTIECRMKPVSGEVDQGGGLVWRTLGPDDYYVCRANPLEENFRLYFVKDGRRHQVASSRAVVEAGTWHTIRVEHEGDRIACWLDGAKLLEAVDSTFPGEGGVGFWTKADAVTSFDDLQVAVSEPGSR